MIKRTSLTANSNLINLKNHLFRFLLALTISGSLFPVQTSPLTADIEKIENKLFLRLKYQQNQSCSPLAKESITPLPRSANLKILAMNWPRFSEGLKKIYLESQDIPSGFIMYTTPRFGIEVYYTLSGPDAIDNADTLSQSSENCCIFNTKPNGIPDYIDITAGALDSAWQMEVVKFGFPAPKPYITTSHSSPIFKVVIKSLNIPYYGLTFPMESKNDSGTGISSLITLRNNWNGWNIDSTIDYQTHPEKGIRITCAHELFHAIQYRMVHTVVDDIQLDQLPVSWIEGSAGMMEELAFPEVNDFLQYTKPYLDDPTAFSVFNSTSGNSNYANVLVCLYLYGNSTSSSSPIEFFKSLFLDNMNTPSLFSQLIVNSSAKMNKTWVDILNAFHTASFFTGLRSVEGRFITDAAKLAQWSYISGEGALSSLVEKSIRPFSMQYCSIVNTDHLNGTLSSRIIIPGARTPGTCAGRIILRNATAVDSVIRFPSRLSDTSMVEVDNWSHWNEAIVIVSNGTASTNLPVKFEFSTAPATNMPKQHIPYLAHRQQPFIFTTLDGRILSSPGKGNVSTKHTGIAAGVYIMKIKTSKTATVFSR